ncbi:MAG: hypothetical protein ACYCOU_01255 [Sulfobacillus sp.]
MLNVKTEINGDILTITVDLSKRHGRSKSGKTTIIASTEGNVRVAEGSPVVMGLNVYTKD